MLDAIKNIFANTPIATEQTYPVAELLEKALQPDYFEKREVGHLVTPRDLTKNVEQGETWLGELKDRGGHAQVVSDFLERAKIDTSKLDPEKAQALRSTIAAGLEQLLHTDVAAIKDKAARIIEEENVAGGIEVYLTDPIQLASRIDLPSELKPELPAVQLDRALRSHTCNRKTHGKPVDYYNFERIMSELSEMVQELHEDQGDAKLVAAFVENARIDLTQIPEDQHERLRTAISEYLLRELKFDHGEIKDLSGAFLEHGPDEFIPIKYVSPVNLARAAPIPQSCLAA